MSKLSTKIVQPPPKVTFTGEGLGTMRSTGSLIILLLSLESPGSRAQILTWAAKDLGISLQELIDEYTDKACSECGVSLLAHRQREGRCF